MRSLSFADDHITLTSSCVDNAWWATQSAKVDRVAIRSAWRVEPGSAVVLFCAKLQPWKRPGDLLEAFAATGIPRAVLVFAGDGLLRQTLYQRAQMRSWSDRENIIGVLDAVARALSRTRATRAVP
jgi:glycosyltransferase involved in cell wall biosynthesis